MLKSLLTNFFNRYLLSATSVTDVYYVLNVSVNITENIPILMEVAFYWQERRANQKNNNNK